MPSLEVIFVWKGAHHKYVHMYAYIHYICEKLFSKTQSTNLAVALQTYLFLEWCLFRFGKELFIYLNLLPLYIYVVYTYIVKIKKIKSILNPTSEPR